MVHLASLVTLINPQEKVHSTQSLTNDKRFNVNLINCPRTIKPMEEGREVSTKMYNQNQRYMYSIIMHEWSKGQHHGQSNLR